jgi:hypothetical protein
MNKPNSHAQAILEILRRERRRASGARAVLATPAAPGATRDDTVLRRRRADGVSDR